MPLCERGSGLDFIPTSRCDFLLSIKFEVGYKIIDRWVDDRHLADGLELVLIEQWV